MARRRFLALAGGGAAAAPLAGILAGCSTGAPRPPATDPTPPSGSSKPTTTTTVVSPGAPFRPPAIPLAVRSPYLHAWLPGETLPGTWAMRWNGQQTQLAGIVRIDGSPWIWAGAPRAPGSPMAHMRQVGLDVTPTRSIFTMEAGGVRLVAEFLSPIEPGDPRRQSVPLSLITVSAAAIDGRSHHVQLYADISGAWATGTTTDPITWATATTALARYWTIELSTQAPLNERGQMAAWGSMVWAASPQGAGLSFQSGRDQDVRGQFARAGALRSSVDSRFRTIVDDPPVFAFGRDLGQVGSGGTTARFVLGHVRTPAIRYMGQPLQPAWTRRWGSWQAMVDDFLTDAPAALSRAAALDAEVIPAAHKRGGAAYAQLCVLSAPQAYGACELVSGPTGQDWAVLKEIGSGAATSTVDIITASSPVWIHLDPGYLAMLLDPVLSYAASGSWHAPWAPHDLGYFYPTADGHASTPTSASDEQMPVQESGGLLVLAEAYAQRVGSATGTAFLSRYRSLWSGWATWLATQLPAPPRQLTTDDFIGSLDHSVNLALLGIVSLGAAGKIFDRLGEHAVASHWKATAAALVPRWQALSMDPSGRHLQLVQGGTGTWGTCYNAYLDRLIGTGLVPDAVTSLQEAWYAKQMERFGLPFESPVAHWARADWEGWTAAWLAGTPVGDELIARMAHYLNTTPQRVPFSDTYWTTTGAQVLVWPVFDQARPVVGALFAPLTLS